MHETNVKITIFQHNFVYSETRKLFIIVKNTFIQKIILLQKSIYLYTESKKTYIYMVVIQMQIAVYNKHLKYKKIVRNIF